MGSLNGSQVHNSREKQGRAPSARQRREKKTQPTQMLPTNTGLNAASAHNRSQ